MTWSDYLWRECRGVALFGIAVVLFFVTLLAPWLTVLLLGYALVWGGDVRAAWRWRRMRRAVANSLAYDDLL